MRSSPLSSSSSWTCRLEWRPSRWLVGALVLLGILAAAALMACGLPIPLKIPAAVLAAGAGACLAARESTRPVVELAWAGHEHPAHRTVAGRTECWQDVELLERGPLLRLRGRDPVGRRQYMLWWPDTLSRADRRTLRLLSGVSRRSDSNLPSMAA